MGQEFKYKGKKYPIHEELPMGKELDAREHDEGFMKAKNAAIDKYEKTRKKGKSTVKKKTPYKK